MVSRGSLLGRVRMWIQARLNAEYLKLRVVNDFNLFYFFRGYLVLLEFKKILS